MRNAPCSKVKGPKSSFIFYYQETMDEIKAANPSLAHSDVAKLIGVKWTELDDNTKEIYK